MNSFSYVSNGKLNLLELKEWLRREFLTFFENSSGKKLLCWDSSLTASIGLISEYSVLKERGVEKMVDLKQIELLKAKDVADFAHIFFIVRPKLELMETIANHILNIEKDRNNYTTKDYHIIFVPRKSMICERKLQDLCVYGTFKDNISEFALDLIPLENDLLTMENPDVYKDCFLYNDHTQLYHIAKSIMTLQSIYGIIPAICGKGLCSKIVADMILQMRKKFSKDNEYHEYQGSKIDNLILIDRTADPITPFLTQLTYEGLIDENFGIKYTQLEMPQKAKQASIGNNNIVESKRNIITLNSSDSLYFEIRDKNYNAISYCLTRTAKELQQAYELKNQLKSTSDMRTYVEKTLKTYQAKKTSLANHTEIASILKEITESEEFIEQLKCEQELLRSFEIDKVMNTILSFIAKGHNIYKVLRLVCLHCFVAGGFKQKILESYKREIIRAYGFKYMELLNNLQQSGLIFLQQNKLYPNLSKSFKLIVDDINEQEPNDISYVYSGYAPLSLRFCQNLSKQNFKIMNDTYDLLPGPGRYFEETQIIPRVSKKRGSILSSNSTLSNANTEQKTTLVFFIGGCTFAEISAFRFLSQLEESNNDFIIATTNMITGTSFLSSLS